MSWGTVQDTIKRAVAQCLKRAEDDPAIEWENRNTASSFTDPYSDGLICSLRLGSVVQKGRGEKRRKIDSDTGDLKTTYGGYRLFTVTCYVSTMSQDSDEDAQSFAGLIRTRIRRDDIHATLKDGNVALVTVYPNYNVDFKNSESRMQSAAILELRFATTEWDTDDQGNLGWIEEAQGDGELATGVNGQPVRSHFDTSN